MECCCVFYVDTEYASEKSDLATKLDNLGIDTVPTLLYVTNKDPTTFYIKYDFDNDLAYFLSQIKEK